MASLDQTYTITLDTSEATAKVDALEKRVDALLAKIATLPTAISVDLSGASLKTLLDIETDRLGRVKGR